MNEPSAPAPLGGQTRRSRKRILLELFIVTAGVLIALLIDSLVEWNRYRVLVNEARATLAREMADNGREVEQVLATMADRDKRIETALRFANEMLAEKKTAVNELQLGFDFADVGSASWKTAAQTGALAHMDYSEVQRYSRLYDLQDLFVEQQRRTLDILSSAIAILGVGDPNQATTDDLKLFRERLLALRGQTTIEQQLAARLAKNYSELLGR